MPPSSCIDTGYVDAKKIGITGGSYGGFMTLMAIGKTPDIWAAAVEMYGIIDWYTMLQHEDPFLQEYEKSLLGDPVKDKAVYEATSPIKYIRNEKAPLLVLQGENDIRVPKEEAEQVVEILKKEGRTVDAHYYPAEGHGFAKRENQIDCPAPYRGLVRQVSEGRCPASGRAGGRSNDAAVDQGPRLRADRSGHQRRKRPAHVSRRRRTLARASRGRGRHAGSLSRQSGAGVAVLFGTAQARTPR